MPEANGDAVPGTGPDRCAHAQLNSQTILQSSYVLTLYSALAHMHNAEHSLYGQ